MSMHVTRLADATPFTPEGHDGVGPVRLQSGEQVSVVLSHYLPGGEAQLAQQPTETCYVVVSGELVMISDGAEETLHPYDSVLFTTGTLRQVVNRSHLPASMLVIRPVSR